MRCVLKPSINWELELQIFDNQEDTFTGPSDFITGNCQRTITMWWEGEGTNHAWGCEPVVGKPNCYLDKLFLAKQAAD